jgi:hypothetical protein
MQAKQHPNEYLSIILDGMNAAQVSLHIFNSNGNYVNQRDILSSYFV